MRGPVLLPAVMLQYRVNISFHSRLSTSGCTYTTSVVAKSTAHENRTFFCRLEDRELLVRLASQPLSGADTQT